MKRKRKHRISVKRWPIFKEWRKEELLRKIKKEKQRMVHKAKEEKYQEGGHEQRCHMVC